jgi:hypothetical protein
MLWTLAFWKGAGERIVKTFAAVTAAQLGFNTLSAAVPTLGLGSFNWWHVLSVSTLSAIGTLCIAIGNADFTAGAPVSAPSAAMAAVTYVGVHGVPTPAVPAPLIDPSTIIPGTTSSPSPAVSAPPITAP